MCQIESDNKTTKTSLSEKLKNDKKNRKEHLQTFSELSIYPL
jgi:hypothetical protein